MPIVISNVILLGGRRPADRPPVARTWPAGEDVRVHELGVTQAIVDAVVERLPDATVTTVRIEIGKLSGVVPDSVRFCFDLIADGTRLRGAELEITEPAGQGRCRTCGSTFTVDDLIVLCPCGSADVDVYGGQQLRISSVEVA